MDNGQLKKAKGKFAAQAKSKTYITHLISWVLCLKKGIFAAQTKGEFQLKIKDLSRTCFGNQELKINKTGNFA
jgi:hypothetical protein